MTLPDNIRTALAADNEDMVSWSSLINFFSTHQSELSLPEKITIYEKCEEFRIFWNTDHIYEKEITKNGKTQVMKAIRQSLNIEQADVNPDNIYTDQELIDYFQTRNQTFQLVDNNNKLAKDSDRDTDLIGEAPALAI